MYLGISEKGRYEVRWNGKSERSKTIRIEFRATENPLGEVSSELKMGREKRLGSGDLTWLRARK